MSDGSTTIAIEQLLDRLAAGDDAAKQQLIERALERLTTIARKLLRSFGGEQRVQMWSMEVVSEAYPRISKALDDVKPGSVGQFFGLARLQMHRVLLDKVRTLKNPHGVVPARGQDTEGQSVAAIEGVTDDDERQRMLVIDLLESLGKLPERQAETVWFKLAGHTHREIGEFLGVHHDTVDTYWNNACVKLARSLAPFMDHLMKPMSEDELAKNAIPASGNRRR
jgi:RNA polymerase sigma factor (sigma-70 family)